MSKAVHDTSSVPAKTVEFTDVIDSAGPPPGPAGPFGTENDPLDHFPGVPHPLKGKALLPRHLISTDKNGFLSNVGVCRIRRE